MSLPVGKISQTTEGWSIFEDCKEGTLMNIAFTSVYHWNSKQAGLRVFIRSEVLKGASASPRNLLQMQVLISHFRPPEWESLMAGPRSHILYWVVVSLLTYQSDFNFKEISPLSFVLSIWFYPVCHLSFEFSYSKFLYHR